MAGYRNISVEAENNELVLVNDSGDHVIIPANKRDWVKKKIKEGCHNCIDALVDTLPIATQYAEFGGVYESEDPENKPTNAKQPTKKAGLSEADLQKLEERIQFYEKYWDLKNKNKDTSKLYGSLPRDVANQYIKKLSWDDAIKYVKTKGLKGEELAEFATRHIEGGDAIRKPEKWKREVEDPNFVAPITKQEIEAYNQYQKKIETQRQATQVFDEFNNYINTSGYKPKGSLNQKLTGKQILENIQKSNQNVKVTNNPDGSFSIYDDIATYTDTDQPFGKQRTFYPDMTYTRNMYEKGRDYVNVYTDPTPSPYTQRIPKPEEIKQYQEGTFYERGLSPQNKVMYINRYLEPGTQNTFSSGGGQEELERYNNAIGLSDELNSFYDSEDGKKYLQAKRNKLPDVYMNGAKVSLADKIQMRIGFNLK